MNSNKKKTFSDSCQLRIASRYDDMIFIFLLHNEQEVRHSVYK